jgi:hypothetical protein
LCCVFSSFLSNHYSPRLHQPHART